MHLREERGQGSYGEGHVDSVVWGELQGEPVHLFTLVNASGLEMKVSEYGATITELHLPDHDGRLADVVLGMHDLEGYLGEHPSFGGVIGRVANRIASGRVHIAEREWRLSCNEGEHHLHGGHQGFHRRLWRARVEMSHVGPRICLIRISPDGEEGYPGQLHTQVTYTLRNDDALDILMEARSDRTTLVNLTQHTYWNLAGHGGHGGHGANGVLDHQLQIEAGEFTAVDDELIPTGQVSSVSGTALDFRQAKSLGRDLDASCGFDINYVLDSSDGELRKVASLSEPESGRNLELWTDQPGLQLYVGGGLDGKAKAKQGKSYGRWQGLALEAQHHPDSPHHPSWPSIELHPGQLYRHRTRFSFGVAGREGVEAMRSGDSK